MSLAENKVVVRQYWDAVINGQHLDLVDELTAPDFIHHTPQVRPGRDGMRRFVAMLRTAFPDLHHTIEDEIAEGDRVVVRWSSRGTHLGVLPGTALPTGKVFTCSGIHIFRVADGKIYEQWEQVDVWGLMRQLGVIPGPGPESPEAAR